MCSHQFKCSLIVHLQRKRADLEKKVCWHNRGQQTHGSACASHWVMSVWPSIGHSKRSPLGTFALYFWTLSVFRIPYLFLLFHCNKNESEGNRLWVGTELFLFLYFYQFSQIFSAFVQNFKYFGNKFTRGCSEKWKISPCHNRTLIAWISAKNERFDPPRPRILLQNSIEQLEIPTEEEMEIYIQLLQLQLR